MCNKLPKKGRQETMKNDWWIFQKQQNNLVKSYFRVEWQNISTKLQILFLLNTFESISEDMV